MATRLFLLLFLTQHVSAKEPPDVECVVMHLKSVRCFWNKHGTPEVNYTFECGLVDNIRECATYLTKNSINTGCDQPYDSSVKAYHFDNFSTKLIHGNKSYQKWHDIKKRVKLNSPVNVTVQNGSDYNLWFYWNQTRADCVESEVRYRKNSNNWEQSIVTGGKQSYCINLPSSSSRYELQVRSKIEKNCGDSIFWSDWSEPVVWGSNNSTDPNQRIAPMSVLTQVLTVMGFITLILLVLMFLQRERIGILIIPWVPEPSPKFNDIENWFQISKDLKESFKANYNERACPVREYCYLSQSDSESSGSSTCSFSTDQSDCSVSIPGDQSDLSTP